MCWESFDVVRFDLGPLLQGHTRMAKLKSGYNSLIIGPRVIYLLFYIAFNSQGHIAMGSLQVEETSAYCTVNQRASASNYQLSNMKRPTRDANGGHRGWRREL